MSDDKKPEAKTSAPKRRAPARKAPTKAAALKALGLTKEDFENLKAAADAVAALRNAKSNDEAVDIAEALAGHPLLRSEVSEKAVAQQASKREAVSRTDPQQFIEDRPSPSSTGQMPETVKEPVWYIRNLRGMEVGFRLSRQTAQGQKRTTLKPRGQRGDIVKLEPGDLQDAELQTQVSYELVEVIPEGEALEAIRKQYTNRSNEVPAHIAMLRNPLGEEYQTGPRTLSDEESMGYKVADLDPRLMQGKLDDKAIKRDGGFAQENIMQPVQNPSPGTIISDGFMAPTQQAVGNAGDNERAAQIDALARSKQFEGPGAGLGEVTVKIEPVQRVQ